MTDGGGEDDSIFDVLDEYGVEYQRERRHGRGWVQIRSGMEIGPHIVDGLRAFGYQLHGFASDTTMNFVKVEDDNGSGVRDRQEIQEKLQEIKEKAIAEPNPPRSSQYASKLAGKHRCLRWVLGEVDDL